MASEHEKTVLVGITGINKYGEKPEIEVDENVLIISKPIHFLSVVPILNGQNTTAVTNLHSDSSLIAPDAKILLVDDNLVNLKVTKGLLQYYKIHVDTASGGFEAIDILHNSKDYDMIFMDHMMPQIDGVDTTKIIRNLPDEYYKNVPIIAFTANAVKDAQLMFLSNGFNDFLAKPIEIKSLKQVLLRWLPDHKKIKSEPLPSTEKTIVSTAFAKKFKKIDVQIGLTSCMGDIDSYKDILRSFASICEKTITNINNSISKNKYTDFTTHVHAVKSSAKSIGAMELSDMALKMENAGKQNDTEYINLYLVDFISLYKAVYKEILDNLDGELLSVESKFKGTKKLEEPKLKEVLLAVAKALEDFDSESATNSFEELKDYSLEADIKQKIIEANEHLEEFEYDKALDIINDLLKD